MKGLVDPQTPNAMQRNPMKEKEKGRKEKQKSDNQMYR